MMKCDEVDINATMPCYYNTKKGGALMLPLSYLLDLRATIERTSGSLFRCRYSYVEGEGFALSGAYS